MIPGYEMPRQSIEWEIHEWLPRAGRLERNGECANEYEVLSATDKSVPNGLKSHKFVTKQFWRSEVENGSPWAN